MIRFQHPARNYDVLSGSEPLPLYLELKFQVFNNPKNLCTTVKWIHRPCPSFTTWLHVTWLHDNIFFFKFKVIYIYIYIYLLTYNLPAFTVTRIKEKKTPGSRDNNISNFRPGEKEKNIIGQKKRKGQLRHTSWKKSRDMQSVGQKKKKTHRKMLQCYNYRECSIHSRANSKN